MGDEMSDSRIRGMDLNLYLGLPPLPRPRGRDLGSDFALGSLPLSPLPREGIHAPTGLPAASESSISGIRYSPSNALYAPELLPGDPLHPADENPSSEYTPYLPSYEPHGISRTLEERAPLESPAVGSPRRPSYVCRLPPGLEANESGVRDGSSHYVPYDLSASFEMADEPFPYGGGGAHMPYLPPYPPALRMPRHRSESSASFGPFSLIRVSELMAQDHGSSSRQELLQYPEFRFRRLFESNHRWRHRRFRSSDPYDGESFNSGETSVSSPERLMHDIVRSSKRHRMQIEGKAVEGSEKEKEEMSEGAANFECNICFELAKEPVVSPCGHLFCWPCLYQWLHVHSVHSECPVCKGEVLEVNLTPIYGRGSSSTTTEKKCGEDGPSGLDIPPRPHGHRVESLRQQLERAITRRSGDGIANSWRHIIYDEMLSGDRLERLWDSSLQGRFDADHHSGITRLRARRMQREDRIWSSSAEVGLPRTTALEPRHNTPDLIFRDVIDRSDQFSPLDRASSDRLASRLPGTFGSSSNQAGSSIPSANHHIPEPLHRRHTAGQALAADQVSVSSVMAVMEGESTSFDDLADLNRAGSPRFLRRTRRSHALAELSRAGSSDVDGALHRPTGSASST